MFLLLMRRSRSVTQPSKKKCKNKIKEIIESGVTVLYVSHNAASVKEICSRSIFLKKELLCLTDRQMKPSEFMRNQKRKNNSVSE